jgi:hypothetical protein
MINFAYYSEWLAGAVAFFMLFKLSDRKLLPLIIYILFVVIADYCSRFASIVLDDGTKSNHYYYNISYIIQIVLFIILVQYWKKPPIAKRSVFVSLISLWLIFSLLNLFVLQGFYILNTWSFLAGYIIIIVLSTLQLFELVQDNEKKSILTQPGFWIWTAFILSATFSFAYRVFEPIMRFSSSKLFLYIIVSSAILKFSMLTIGLLCTFINRKQLQTFNL